MRCEMSPEAGSLLVYLQERARGPRLAANRGLEINPERILITSPNEAASRRSRSLVNNPEFHVAASKSALAVPVATLPLR